MPVSASFDPADQAGCRSLLDWFERGAAPSGAVLLVDDWALCAAQDPELDQVVEWVAAFGPARGVQTVVTARDWDSLPARLRRHLHGEATDFLALHGIEPGLGNKYQRRDLKAAVGVDERGWPVYLNVSGLPAACYGPVEQREQKVLGAVLGLMVTHSSNDLNFGFFDVMNTGMFDGADVAPHVAFTLTGDGDDEFAERLQAGLAGELDRRQRLVHGYRDFHDYREKAGDLPALLLCVDRVDVLVDRHPGFGAVLDSLTRAGRAVGIYLLYSGDVPLPFQLPEWPAATPPPDFAEWADMLPELLVGSAPPAHEIMLPPLNNSHSELTLDMLPPGAIGIVDKPHEQRRDELYLGCGDGERRFGVFVGAPGTGKSTALRTLAHALGPDLPRYQLLDGPGEPIDPEKHVVVTARTWAEIPAFMMEKLAFAVEFRLDDPSTSRVDPRLAARLPAHPGIGLFLNNKLVVRIAKS